MKVVAPTPITDALFVSSNITETDKPEWAAATTYAKGAQVQRSPSHRIWQSAIDNNKGVDPTGAGQTAWIDAGPTNRWAMLDQAVGTNTVGKGTIDVVLAPGSVNSLAVLDTDAETVRVIMRVNGTVIYDRTQTTNVSGGVIADYYAYFFSPIGKVMTLSFLDLPLYANGQIEVIITGKDPNGPVKTGTLLVGRQIDLGSTEVGASPGINDYSRKETDEFGITDVVPRDFSKRGDVRTLIETSAVDGVLRSLAGIRATPCLWLGEDGFDSLAIYGFYKNFTIEMAVGINPATRSGGVSYLNLSIEGMI